MRHSLAALVLGLAACSSSVAPTNPYDPATPPDQQTKGRVRGTLLYSGAGPAVDVTVFLRRDGSIVRQTTTAADGAFLIDAVVPGSYSLEVSPTGFVPLTMPLKVKPGEALDIGTVGLTAAGASAAIEGTATLAGEADHGGTLVEAVGRAYTAVTNSLGQFHLDVAEGTYTLRLSHKDFVTITVQDVTVVHGETRLLDPLSLPANPATLTGHVDAELAAGGSAPLALATVTLEGTGITGFTNTAGDFSLTGVPAGSYLLHVFKLGYSSASVPVLDVVGGETRAVDPAFSLSLSRGGVSGSVALADTSDASGVVIEVAGTSRAVVTGSDGKYTFDGLLPGPYDLSAHRDGYARRDLGTWTVEAGATTAVTQAVLIRQGGAVTVAEGPYVNVRSVHLVPSAGVAGFYKASEDPALPGAWLALAGSGQLPFTLSDLDGEHTIHVVFSADGITGGTRTAATVVLDRQKPSAPSVVIGDGSGFSRVPGGIVSLSLSARDDPAIPGAVASGIARVQIANDSTFSAPDTRDYALTTTWTLSPTTDGPRSVSVRFIDRAGNVSDTVTAPVILDTARPAGPAIALAGPPPSPECETTSPTCYTTSPVVTATLSATDANAGADGSALLVRLSNSPGFEGAFYQAYARTLPWTLVPGDGEKTVWAQFMDPAGNESLPVSAKITLSTAGPTSPVVMLTENDDRPHNGFTNVLTVDLALSAGGSPTAAQVSEDPSFPTGIIPVKMDGVPQPVLVSFPLGGSGLRTVWVRFQNRAGNYSNAVSASVTVDATKPPAPQLVVHATLADGSPSSTLAASSVIVVQPTEVGDAVELTTGQPAPGAACALPASPTWYPLAPSVMLVLDPPDGQKTLCAWTRDAAGNVSDLASATVELDTVPPSNPSFRDLTTAITNATTVTGTLVAASVEPSPGPYHDVSVTYQRFTSAAGTWVDCDGTCSPPTFTFDLVPNAANVVGIRARDTAGNVSAGTLVSIVQDGTPPLPPRITDLETTEDSLTVSWQPGADTDIDHFLVYYGNSSGDRAGVGAAQGPSPVRVAAQGGGQSFTLTGLATGLLYYVTVEAVDRAGNRSGPSAERVAEPNRVNPRVVANYGAKARTLAVVPTAGRVFAYLATNQGVLQLDVTSEKVAPQVVGRATVPDIVPDAPPAILPCSRAGASRTVSGHCVIMAGTTLQGSYNGTPDDDRTTAPVVFFPLDGSAAAPAVGLLQGALPSQPQRVVAGTVAGQDVLLAIERGRVVAFDLTLPSFPRTLASVALPSSMTRVQAASLQGTSLYVYGPVAASSPHLQVVEVVTSPAFALTVTDVGVLRDHAGAVLGDGTPAFDAGLEMAYLRNNGTGALDLRVCSYASASTPAVPRSCVVAASGLSTALHIGSTAGGNGHVDVLLSSDHQPGYADYRVNVSGTALSLPRGTTPILQDGTDVLFAALGVYPTSPASQAEHLFVLEAVPFGAGDARLQRWTIDAGSTATSSPAYEDHRPRLFAESDRFVFVARGSSIDTVDLANPLSPTVSSLDRAGSSFRELLVLGRYLYANDVGTVAIEAFRIGGTGDLTYAGSVSLPYPAQDLALSGRWLFAGGLGYLWALDLADPAAPVATGKFTTPSALYRAVGAAPITAAAGLHTTVLALDAAGILGTFGYDGATLVPLGSVAVGGNQLPTVTSIRVAGPLAVVSGPSGTTLVDISRPSEPSVKSAVLPVSLPLVQGGYLVGLATGGDPGGPVFDPYLAGASVDGTSPYSGCTSSGDSTVVHRDGAYVLSCGDNGLIVFSAADGRHTRLLGRHDLSAQWYYDSAALATDGYASYLAGAYPFLTTDAVALYTASNEQNAGGVVTQPVAVAHEPQAYRYPQWLLSQGGLLWSFEASDPPAVVAYETGDPLAAWPVRSSIPLAGSDKVITQPVSDGARVYLLRIPSATIEAYDVRSSAPLRTTPVATRSIADPSYLVGALAVSRDRLYVAISDNSNPTILVLDTTDLSSSGPAAVTVDRTTTTTITGLAISGRWLFYTYSYAPSAAGSWGLRVVRLGPGRDGAGAVVVGDYPSAEPLSNPIVSGDRLFVSSNLGVATFDLTPLWRESVMPTLLGATARTETSRGNLPVRMIVDGPFAYVVGGTYRVYDLR